MKRTKITPLQVVWSIVLFVVIIMLAGFFLGLLLPPTPGALRKAERAHAATTAYNLKNAISAYFTEYRDYPRLDPAKDITIDSGHALMDILLASDSHKTPGGRNPRSIVFYMDKEAKPMGGGRFRRGLTFHPLVGTGELWDPWGNRYRVRFDTDGNGQVENPKTPGTFLPETIAVWSAGPDGDFDTWKDNVKTW